MKEWEAFKLARETGAKIRRNHWEGHCYMFFKNGSWAHNNRCNATVCLTGFDDWELYQEPIKTFGPDRAMYWLERWKKVKRQAWTGKQWIERAAQAFKDESDRRYPHLDWFHNDWHLCDEHGNYIPEPEEMAK